MDTLSILHSGASPNHREVDGINSLIWTLAAGQAARGDVVALQLLGEPNIATKAFADERGIKLISGWDETNPDIVHCHSVFIPAQVALCRSARGRLIPYVITPNGGLAAEILSRGRLKKTLYSIFVERPRFSGAAAIIGVMPPERADIANFVPRYRGRVAVIPNAIEDVVLSRYRWQRQEHRDRRKLVYLGRFDVDHKGIDLLAAVAGVLAETDIHIYGRGSSRAIVQLQRARPRNLHFHEPVYDEEKIKVLLDADMYVQMSRWEVFGISVAEAMSLGVPCAITESMYLASEMKDHGLGLTIPLDPVIAAEKIRAALSDAMALQSWSTSARQHALSAFGANTVIVSYAHLYREVANAEMRFDA